MGIFDDADIGHIHAQQKAGRLPLHAAYFRLFDAILSLACVMAISHAAFISTLLHMMQGAIYDDGRVSLHLPPARIASVS